MDLTLDRSKRWKTPQPPKKTERSKADIPGVRSKSREAWFSQGLGRLQTAVVEHITTGFNGVDLDEPRPRPRRLARRQVRTANDVSGSTIEVTFDRNPQSLPRRRQRKTSPSMRPVSRAGNHVDSDSRPRSSRVFDNPFESSSRPWFDDLASMSDVSSRPRTSIQQLYADCQLAEASNPKRPMSSPQTRRNDPKSTPVMNLPQRSKTQVYRTDPDNKWRRGQIIADAFTPEMIQKQYKYAPAAGYANTGKQGMFEPPLEKHMHVKPSDQTIDARTEPTNIETKLQSLDFPSALNLQLLDLSLADDSTSSTKHGTGTKYDFEHDLWTPATSPSQGQSSLTSAHQSHRSSMQYWAVPTPLSPEMSPPSTFVTTLSSKHQFIPPPPPPARPAPAKPQTDVEFGASQETIRAIQPAHQAPVPRSDSLSIGRLPFESTDDKGGVFFSSEDELGDSLSDLQFLGSSIF